MTALVLLLLVSLAAVALAERVAPTVVISSGRKDGSYHAIAGRLRNAIPSEVAHVEILTSAGSAENLARIADTSSSVNVALTQSDALRLYLEKHPDFADEMIVLGDAGRECAILIAGAEGPKDASALARDPGGTIAVGETGSGAAATWEYLGRLEPAFRNTRPEAVGIPEALVQLRSPAEPTKMRAALLVQRPSARSHAVNALRENPEAYRLLPITPEMLPAATRPEVAEVYRFDTVYVGGEEGRIGQRNRRQLSVETLCTRALLIGAKAKLDGEVRQTLAQLLLESGRHIIESNS